MQTSNQNTNAPVATQTESDLSALFNDARRFNCTMSVGEAAFMAVNQAIDFGWLNKADKYGMIDAVSTALTNWLATGSTGIEGVEAR